MQHFIYISVSKWCIVEHGTGELLDLCNSPIVTLQPDTISRSKVLHFDRSSLKFVPVGSIDIKSSLFQVMASQRTGDKPMPEPMITQLTNTYATPYLKN